MNRVYRNIFCSVCTFLLHRWNCCNILTYKSLVCLSCIWVKLRWNIEHFLSRLVYLLFSDIVAKLIVVLSSETKITRNWISQFFCVEQLWRIPFRVAVKECLSSIFEGISVLWLSRILCRVSVKVSLLRRCKLEQGTPLHSLTAIENHRVSRIREQILTIA
jgi:hypothetical protein